MTTVTDAYSRRAAEYTDLLGSMNSVHPSDRQLIDTWAGVVGGRVLDAGCGPGHWTSYLTGRGLDIYGIDLVPSFLEHARSAYPDTTFRLGSIDNIQEQDESLGGILSWYSTIHHDPSRIAGYRSRSSRARSEPVVSSCSGISKARKSNPSITQ